MRKLGPAVACALALLSAGTAPGQSIHLNTMACGDATDVVLTDAGGRVLETWRGELRPGAVVRLGPARLTPADALPWDYLRLRPERALSAMYRASDELRLRDLCRDSELAAARRQIWYTSEPGEEKDVPPPMLLWPIQPDGAEANLRLVLFLRKEATIPGIETVWLPAGARADGEADPPVPGWRTDTGFRGSRYEFSGNVSKDDFRACVALVEGGRVVSLEYSEHRNAPQWAPVAQTLKEFKGTVTRYPHYKPWRWAPERSDASGSLRTWADFGTLIPSLPEPPHSGN